MKVLIVDGNWCLKRNYYKGGSLEDSEHHLCGGLIGFLISLQTVMNKIIPDRVIIAWDGFNAGKLRYEVYKPYKAEKNKVWSEEVEMIENEGITNNNQEKDEFEILKQKIALQRVLEELFIRQIEVSGIEAIDLIAGYVLKSEIKEAIEEIVIFGKEKDFNQLISKNVSVIGGEQSTLITNDNFKEKKGYIIDNELLFRCFEGNKSDGIDGVRGATDKALIKAIPDLVDRKYSYKELKDRCEKKIEEEKKKQQIYKKVIDSRQILYRNVELMNLKKPFLNEEAMDEIDNISTLSLDKNRNIKEVVDYMVDIGYMNHIKQITESDIDPFFSIFYILMDKEFSFSVIP